MGGVVVTRPVLIAGIPRSGTSWVLQVLRRTSDVIRVYEPDNEWHHVQAMRAKRDLGRFPVLAAGDDSPELAALWARALSGRAGLSSPAGKWAESLFRGATNDARQQVVDGGGMSARLRAAVLLAGWPGRARPAASETPVVKSVHCVFSLEWIAARWDPQIVLVTRDPRNVIASWLEMDLRDRDRRLDDDPRVRAQVLEPLGLPPAPSSSDPLHRAAWHLGVLSAALDRAAAGHPDWRVVRHEDLCVDPRGRFQTLTSQLGLSWTDACDAFLQSTDTDGAGYEVRRVAADQPDRWRTRLTPAQVDTIAQELARFPRMTAGDRPAGAERPS